MEPLDDATSLAKAREVDRITGCVCVRSGTMNGMCWEYEGKILETWKKKGSRCVSTLISPNALGKTEEKSANLHTAASPPFTLATTHIVATSTLA